MVKPTSIDNHSIISSAATTSLGGMIEVINALLSLSKDSFLNPEEFSEICPKLELELVIEASPPVSASKCLVNPMAKTETI